MKPDAHSETGPPVALSGSAPPGTSNERQAARWVQQMFAGIAPRYDLLNHLLSFNVDRAWRRALRQSLSPVLARPDAKILDLCCGTGDVLLDFQARSASLIFGADFCHPMLVSARAKAARRGLFTPLFEADALQLPLPPSTLDAISVAFGFRNLANYESGLKEFHRVLKPGGSIAILEFSHPTGFVKAAYRLYSRALLPLVGALVSGSREAYTYLPDSIQKFPRAEPLRAMLERAGFASTCFQLLTGGIAALHVGEKRA